MKLNVHVERVVLEPQPGPRTTTAELAALLQQALAAELAERPSTDVRTAIERAVHSALLPKSRHR